MSRLEFLSDSRNEGFYLLFWGIEDLSCVGLNRC